VRTSNLTNFHLTQQYNNTFHLKSQIKF
jgi:hypothetical protein